MDSLSGVLNSVQLDGALYLEGEFSAPWCIRGRYGLADVKQRLAGAEHIVFFHYLVEGSCQVRLAEGGETIVASADDLVLIPWDDRHVMGSDLQLAPVDTESLVGERADPEVDLTSYRVGGGGATTRFVCGYLACSRAMVRPLLDALPRVARISLGEGPAGALVRELLRAGVRESSRPGPGAQTVLAKLAELIFVASMRRHLEVLPREDRSWLAGLRDTHVGRALALLHAAPDRAWTVDGLAREVALSRSAFATRFVALVGEPPMQYLKRWRLALAARRLRGGDEALVRIAERSGYDSEASFSRAFRREFGMPPAAWRRAATLGPDPVASGAAAE